MCFSRISRVTSSTHHQHNYTHNNEQYEQVPGQYWCVCSVLQPYIKSDMPGPLTKLTAGLQKQFSLGQAAAARGARHGEKLDRFKALLNPQFKRLNSRNSGCQFVNKCSGQH